MEISGLSLLTNGPGTTCTPTKDGMDDVLSIITPEMKKMLFTSQESDDDDDSGISMGFKKLPEDKPMPRFSALCSDNPSDSLTPDICFQIRRSRKDPRTRSALFGVKRPLEDETMPSPKLQRCENLSNFKRSFSFGDQPAKKHISPIKEIREVEYVESRLLPAESSPQNDVESAVSRLSENQDLIADGSGTFCLPIVIGKHPDLKSVSIDTVASLLNGDFDKIIQTYKIIDCRYPYEFEGGHIKGAENRYTHESILELLYSQDTPSISDKRNLLIFHCEFSSERAPKLCRFLRQKDREHNKEHYPALNYPEVYVLHGGYKAFYEKQKELCEPIAYKPMLHSDHSADLRHFRIKSKSWTAGEKRKYAMKTLRF